MDRAEAKSADITQPKIVDAWTALFLKVGGEGSPEREQAKVRSALRRERLLGRSGHRAYSLVRHMALARKLRELTA